MVNPHRRSCFFAIAGLLSLAGCAHSPPAPVEPNDGPAGQPPATPDMPPASEGCGPAPSGAAEGWARLRSHAIARLGDPVHAVVDGIALEGEAATIEGKFSYGPGSADLENEPVRAYVREASCARWSPPRKT